VVPHPDSQLANNSKIQPVTLNVLEEKRQSVVDLEQMAMQQLSCIQRNSERIM
jgi:hypothetical protein